MYIVCKVIIVFRDELILFLNYLPFYHENRIQQSVTILRKVINEIELSNRSTLKRLNCKLKPYKLGDHEK